MVYERRAQTESTFTSTDATDVCEPAHKRRVRKRKLVVETSESDSEGDNLASTIPPDKLFNYSPLKESNLLNRFVLYYLECYLEH